MSDSLEDRTSKAKSLLKDGAAAEAAQVAEALTEDNPDDGEGWAVLRAAHAALAE